MQREFYGNCWLLTKEVAWCLPCIMSPKRLPQCFILFFFWGPNAAIFYVVLSLPQLELQYILPVVCHDHLPAMEVRRYHRRSSYQLNLKEEHFIYDG